MGRFHSNVKTAVIKTWKCDWAPSRTQDENTVSTITDNIYVIQDTRYHDNWHLL